jgi:hypothetical protein
MCITAIALALTAAGTAYGAYNQHEAAGASKKAENLREEQMKLDAERQRRKQIRDMLAARATALSNVSNNAGSGGLDSSAFGGAQGQITNVFGNNQNDLSQSVRIGQGIFQANAAQAEAQGQAAIGGAIASMGKDLFAAGPKLNNIGQTIFGGSNTTSAAKRGFGIDEIEYSRNP